jgi:hypothetical protein
VTTISGVTVIGNQNIVNTQFADLSRALTEMEKAITTSEKFKDEAKLNVASDIETIQVQLAKPEPNRGIIKTIWTGIETIVTGAEFATLMLKIKTLLGPLIGIP